MPAWSHTAWSARHHTASATPPHAAAVAGIGADCASHARTVAAAASTPAAVGHKRGIAVTDLRRPSLQCLVHIHTMDTRC